MIPDTKNLSLTNGPLKKLSECHWCERRNIPRIKYRGVKPCWEHVFVDESGQSDTELCPYQEYHWSNTARPSDIHKLLEYKKLCKTD